MRPYIYRITHWNGYYTVTIPASVNTADDLTIYFAANAFSPPHDRRMMVYLLPSQ